MDRVSYTISGRLVKLVLEGESPGDRILGTLKAALDEVEGTRGPCLLLIDARLAATRRPTSEVRSIATRFIKLAPMVERLAVLTASDFHHGLARVALSISETDSVAATTCRSVTEASRFLGVDLTEIEAVKRPSSPLEEPPENLPDPPAH